MFFRKLEETMTDSDVPKLFKRATGREYTNQETCVNDIRRLGAVSDSHYPMLLMASYCGGDNPKCTDELPCENCLKMSNIVLIPKDQVKSENIISGYDFHYKRRK